MVYTSLYLILDSHLLGLVLIWVSIVLVFGIVLFCVSGLGQVSDMHMDMECGLYRLEWWIVVGVWCLQSSCEDWTFTTND